jgi:hypothetical protein
VVLVIWATPFLAGCSLALIVVVCGLVDYDLFGRDNWRYALWALGQLLAYVFLILVLGLCEAGRLGGQWVYAVLGTLAGAASLYFLQTSEKFDQIFWVPLLQYGLVGYLLGRIAYRGVNCPASAPDSTSGAKEKSEKET